VVICRTRRYQMNEVARCAQIAAGLCAIAAPPEPVALIDIGTGAGLGLQLDRYRFVIGGRELGSPAARLSLSCAALGRLAPPVTALPPISSATGIELSPVDLQDPAARAWLAACAPPEASALTRLAAATEITRSDPRPVVAGDAVDELPAVLASLPPGQHAVVTDAYVAVFLPPGRRRLLAAALAAASHSRRVTWLSLDPLVPFGPGGRDSVQGLPLPAPLVRDYQRSGVFAVLGAVTFAGGARQERSGRLLARAHPSGQWMEWLDVT
jgi:hypothetical protein